MYLCKTNMFRHWNVKLWIIKYCYFLCINHYCKSSKHKNKSSGYNPLIIHPKEYSHYNLSEEAKLLLPVVTAPLQTGNIRIWPTRTEHTRVQPVIYRWDLPNSTEWNTISLVVTAWSFELTKMFYNVMLLLIPLKKVYSL